jgi:hypothetical protein
MSKENAQSKAWRRKCLLNVAMQLKRRAIASVLIAASIVVVHEKCQLLKHFVVVDGFLGPI